MIALAIASVLIAGMATYVAHRHVTVRLELERERIGATAMAADRQLDGIADRLRQLDDLAESHATRLGELERRLSEIGGVALETARALNERDAEHVVAIKATAEKYDKIITHGINEMRELVKPIDAHFKQMVNNRAAAAVPRRASNGR